MSTHHHSTVPSDPELRVKALESLLVEKGLVDPKTLDELVDLYETKIGPRNGAKVVAKAWKDPEFKKYLLEKPTDAIASIGYRGRQGEHMRVVENTADTHNIVVCTLCSCYPRNLLGLPPDWYKSRAYRSRTVREPRKVLAEFGLDLPDDVTVRVHDSTADMRYIVVPARPRGTEGWDEERLAALVTRDSMIGTGLPRPPT